jgi:hypothetical protein
MHFYSGVDKLGVLVAEHDADQGLDCEGLIFEHQQPSGRRKLAARTAAAAVSAAKATRSASIRPL